MAERANQVLLYSKVNDSSSQVRCMMETWPQREARLQLACTGMLFEVFLYRAIHDLHDD
jgi:hypothetical protein